MTNILTPSQTCGPLFGFALLPAGITEAVAADDLNAIVIEGTLYDCNDKHLGFEAFLEIWSAEQACRIRTFDGKFRAIVRKPAPVQHVDGGVEAPHLHVAIFARGLTRHLITRIYFPDEQEKNAADPVLGKVDAARHPVLIAQAGDDKRKLKFDIKLQGANESVFFRLGEEQQ